ncbi:cellulase family glycosylhydrolase, partial [Motilibacter deserti]
KKPAVKKPAVKKPTCLAPLPVVSDKPQPGPISKPVDAPLVPTVAPLGRTLPEFFGLHVTGAANATSWPAATASSFGSIRLWDTGTTWADLEPEPGQWAWAKLDAVVAAAEAHGLKPLLVLGQTPTWASSDPSAPGVIAPGSSMPPADMSRWSSYVSAVASRYKGRIEAYEIWNEPNFVGDYFHGSEAELAKLTGLAYKAVKSADPRALVLSPGFATRTKGQVGWIYRYFDAPGARDIDVVSLHLYPFADQDPEDAVGNLETLATVLRNRGVSKPVWNTEVNYGVVGGINDAVTIPEPLASAYVARTLLLDRAAGVDRVFWYSWGEARILGISLGENAQGPTAPARAWSRVSGWLADSVLVGCTDTQGVYACSLRPNGGGWAQVVWRRDGSSGLAAPAGTTGVVGLDGSVVSRAQGDRIAVGTTPVLVVGGGADAARLSVASARG